MENLTQKTKEILNNLLYDKFESTNNYFTKKGVVEVAKELNLECYEDLEFKLS
jgi:hypothetical protein